MKPGYELRIHIANRKQGKDDRRAGYTGPVKDAEAKNEARVSGGGGLTAGTDILRTLVFMLAELYKLTQLTSTLQPGKICACGKQTACGKPSEGGGETEGHALQQLLVTLANSDKSSHNPVGGVAKPVVEKLPERSYAWTETVTVRTAASSGHVGRTVAVASRAGKVNRTKEAAGAKMCTLTEEAHKAPATAEMTTAKSLTAVEGERLAAAEQRASLGTIGDNSGIWAWGNLQSGSSW